MRWLPFQLNPDLPERGVPRAEYVARKFGARASAVYARVAAAGREVGIAFAFERIRVQPNTLQAHRLLWYGERRARQDALAEELFRAYFLEGADLTDRELLADLGARAGLERAALASFLAGEEGRAAVLEADRAARAAGIGGVPFFLFDGRVGVTGAQDPEVLLEAMEQAAGRDPR